MAFCVRCGAEYAAGQRTCEKCASALPDIASAPDVATVEPSAASPLKRVLAGAIDGAIAAAIIFYFVRVLAPRMLLRGRGTLIAGFAVLALPAIYLLLRDAFGGKSIGKLLLGVTVFNTAKARVAGISDSILRNLIFGFTAVPYVGWAIAACMGLIAGVQILSGKPQRWGDGLAQTIVVDDAELRTLG